MNLKEEWLEGKLCEKGLMKEEVKGGDLVRKITPKGLKKIKDLLETDKECRIFLLKHLLLCPDRKEVVKIMMERLKGI